MIYLVFLNDMVVGATTNEMKANQILVRARSKWKFKVGNTMTSVRLESYEQGFDLTESK